jgi:predicted phage-related endonuclease
LLDQKKGVEKEIDENTQRLFDKGHAVEAAARPIVEDLIGQPLFSKTFSRGNLLASLDGISLDGEIVFEHKLMNKDIAQQMQETGEPVEMHAFQLEQQLLCSGAKKAIFVMSDGTPENMVHVEYESKPERRQKLVESWAQFQLDLRDHVVKTVVETPVATPIRDLPAVSFRLDGLTLISNLDEYKTAALELVEKSKLPIESDQNFADCELLNKKFKDAEKRIDAIKADVLGEISDIDAFTKDITEIQELFRQARLNGEKQVKNRKAEIRAEIIAECSTLLDEHVDEINKRFDGQVRLPILPIDFVGSMKGKKTISSLRDSAKTHLTEMKVESSRIGTLIQANLLKIPDEFKFLFADLQSICDKQNDDFKNLVATRINEHKQQQAEKEAQEKATETFAESIEETIETPVDDDAPFDDDAPAINAADILALREVRQLLQACVAEFPQCTSTKADIVATKVKTLLSQAIETIDFK